MKILEPNPKAPESWLLDLKPAFGLTYLSFFALLTRQRWAVLEILCSSVQCCCPREAAKKVLICLLIIFKNYRGPNKYLFHTMPRHQSKERRVLTVDW